MDLTEYRQSENEKRREADLLRIVPKNRRNVIDIGARDGHYSKLLTEFFDEVVALDLELPKLNGDKITPVSGNVCDLQFEDGSFDCVFCAEVLEHIDELERATAQMERIARHEIVIGVPYKQDIRVARTTCNWCGKVNPPWAHVNRFDEQELQRLFPKCEVSSVSYVGESCSQTNPLSALLMDLASNPWGTYDQEEPCRHCGKKMSAPENRGLLSRCCSALAYYLNSLQRAFSRPHPNWMHAVLRKRA